MGRREYFIYKQNHSKKETKDVFGWVDFREDGKKKERGKWERKEIS